MLNWSELFYSREFFMALTLIFEDYLEGFSLEIAGKSFFDVTQVSKLEDEIQNLKKSFSQIFKNINLSQFQFTLADTGTPHPKIQIYAESKSEWIDGLGILTREQLVQLFEKINKQQELAKQNKNEGSLPSTSDSIKGDLELSGEDKQINKSPNQQDLPSTKTPSKNKSVGTDAEKKDQPSKPTNPQVDLSDTVDSDGKSLKQEFDIRTEILYIREFSDESQFMRFSGTTTEGRQFKFFVQNDDELNLVKISSVWNLPIKLTFDAASDKNKTFKNYIEIEFEEEIVILSKIMSQVARMHNNEQKLKTLDEISEFIKLRLKDFAAEK